MFGIPFILGLLGKIDINSIIPSIIGGITSLVKNIVHNWKVWLIALLIAGNVGFFWEWRHTGAQLTVERAAHAADVASYKKAQAVANAKAQSERANLLKESKTNADKADSSYHNLLTQYRANLLRYKGPSKGTSGGSGDNQLFPTQGPDGSGQSTDLPATLTITGDDAETCAENTARLQAGHDWAIKLPTQAEEIK